MKSTRHARYARHRFPAEVISHAVWLYFRFPLSLRIVEEMLAARGLLVSHETVRQGSVANSVFTCLYWGARAGWRLENQRLSAVVVTGNRAEKYLYFEFATEPFGSLPVLSQKLRQNRLSLEACAH
jgi:hypothetical protein